MLLPQGSVLKALKEKVQVPQHKHMGHSVSKHIRKHAENPLEYARLVQSYGYKLEKMVYPDCHLLPPFLEKAVDPKGLEDLKGKTCIRRAEDWRSLFIGFEFLSFLRV